MTLLVQKTKTALAVLFLLSAFTSCGSSSAPPVSIPAPVTGRITITSPDEDGVALVVGDDEAVTADSVVHVTNETQASSASLFLEKIFRPAYAQETLPSICSQAFHACGRAESDGSFEVEMTASENDEISVEIIDETTGAAETDKIRKPVPENILLFVRPVRDVQVRPSTNQLYALMGNSELTPNTGIVTIYDLETETRDPNLYDGSDPRRMVFHQDTAQAVILDGQGEFAALVDLSRNNFLNPLKVTGVSLPQDAIFNTAGTAILVSHGPSSDVAITQITLSGGSATITERVEADDLPGYDRHDNTLGIDLIRYTTPTRTFDLVAFVSAVFQGETFQTVVGLLDADNMQVLSNLAVLPDGTAPNDVAFFRTEDRLLITDEQSDQILVYSFSIDLSAETPATLTFEGQLSSNLAGVITGPREIEVDPVNELAFITARNGTEERPDTVMTVDLPSRTIVDINPVGHNPTGLFWDSTDQILYVSARRTRSVTFWGLTELQP